MIAMQHVNAQQPRSSSHTLTWRMDPELSFSDWKIEIFVPPSVLHGTYHVHKVVLAVGPKRSKYFERLFRSTAGFLESNEKTSRIEMEEAAANAFPAMLDYLYSSSGQYRVEYNGSAAMYHLGEYFGIHSLCGLAAARWEKPARIPPHCLVALYEQATIFGIDKLLKAILQACCGTNFIEKRSYPIRDDAHFWLDVIKTNGGTPNEHLCTLVADYCTSKGGDMEVYKRIRGEEGHLEVLTDETVWKFLQLEQSISPRDDSASTEFTNVQNKCIESLAASWQQPDPTIPQHFRAKLDPRVLAETFSKVKAYRLPIRVIVSGAGCSAVNGIYIRCQSTDDFAPKYVMENGRWCGEDAVFSIEPFLQQSTSWAWYISIVDDEQPGTERDIDFYVTERCSKRLRRPPVSGWRSTLATSREGFGVDPVPSIVLVYDEEMDVDN